MARQVRIEFPGAFYHVMARGNRLDPIFVSPKGKDQELFLKTLGEACEQTGFRIWAWVLMKNHYHLVIETPKPNLVAGMAWLQNTYTRRFNTRHKAWGRLFGDRYKSILIEDDRSGGGSSYLATLFDYVHLNPARAGLIAPQKPKADSILDYPWSSVAHGYALSPKNRPKWLRADAGLELFGFQDKVGHRRRFVERLDARMLSEAGTDGDADHCGVAEIDGQTLNSTLRRGWYWGSEEFKETMLRKLDELSVSRRKDGAELPTSHDYKESSQARDHNLRTAETIIRKGVKFFELEKLPEGIAEGKPLPRMPRGDLSAVAIAWAIRRNTTVPCRWIAERLSLGSAGNVSERVRRFERIESGDLDVRLKKWKALDF